jgi:hypothetical protein
MSAQQGIGHTARRDSKGLHNKRPKHKRKRKGRYQPFEGARRFTHPVSWPSNFASGFFFIVLNHNISNK